MENELTRLVELDQTTIQESFSHDESRQPVGFSVAWTIVCTIVVGGGIGLMVWAYDSLTALENVEDPERALEHIVGRSMDFESSLTRGSEWEQSFNQALNGHNDDASTKLIGWYDELIAVSDDPLSTFYAAVLVAEADKLDGMNRRIESWKGRPSPFPVFREILQVAYGNTMKSPEEMAVLQARLAEEVPENWFYSQLALRLARQAEDSSFESTIDVHKESRIEQVFWRNRLLMVTEVSLTMVSVLALLFVMWRRYQMGSVVYRLGEASLPPPWFGRDGFAVLMRGGALTLLFLAGLGALLGAYFSFIDGGVDSKLMELVSTVMLYAPIPFLLYHYLLRPKGHSLSQVFGLQLILGKAGILILTVLALFACGMVGDLVISVGGEAIGKTTHWTEWFNDSLVWGGYGDLTILFLEVAVLAPIFEEIIFRGIVFGSLRRRFGWLLSALLSATIFALVHGYGIVGFCAVWWSGFLWAWAYEKTGSLLPGIMAHALNNFVFLMSLLVIFR
ncbi:MAG: lysostaphin resistance A-like protein [Nitrospirales bacterium]